MNPLDPALREMLDEHQLHKLVHRYCRAVDRGDVAELRRLYHHDAQDSHGSFSRGTAHEFIDQIAAARPFIRSMQHHVTTTTFAVDGDVAEGEVYTVATHTFAAGDRDVDVIVGGRYLDRYERREGVWKFVERAIVTDWAQVNDPSRTDLSHPVTRDTPTGSMGADDPSFAFFTLLGMR